MPPGPPSFPSFVYRRLDCVLPLSFRVGDFITPKLQLIRKCFHVDGISKREKSLFCAASYSLMRVVVTVVGGEHHFCKVAGQTADRPTDRPTPTSGEWEKVEIEWMGIVLRAVSVRVRRRPCRKEMSRTDLLLVQYEAE